MPPAQHLLSKRYQLHEKLGEGGMGSVYRAVDRLNGQTVALKMVSVYSDSSQASGATVDFRVTLAQEFKVLASMRHPHIITVLDYGFDDQQPYITMELLEDARTFLDAGQDESLERQIQLIIEVLQALAYLHRRGVLHRDLKPSNVLVTPDGNVKVLDFGLAIEEAKAESEALSGTLAYLAPELLMERNASIASDLYAVGVMAYEMLAGHHPFNDQNVLTLVHDVLHTEPNMIPLMAGAADDTYARYDAVAKIIEHLLEKEPSKRYRDAYKVIQDLSEAVGQPMPQESAAIRDSYLQSAMFVGRETELLQLYAALRTAQQKQGSAWLVGGESGAGKSRLLEELRIRALVQGIIVLNGQAVENGGVPYQLWRAPLRRLLLISEIEEVDAGILKDIVPDIEALLGYPVADAPPVEGTAYQQRLWGTIVSLFQRQTQPLLLLLEDLQWSTESLEVLKLLTGMVAELPLLIVGSFRQEEHPNLPHELPMQLLRLDRLTQEHIAQLSESMLGDAGRNKNLLRLLERETEGNVYFLVEVVRSLAEEAGRLSEVGRTMLPERVLAGGVQSVIQRRLARIPESHRPLLQLAAVAGREIDLALLQNLKNGIDIDEWLMIGSNCAVLELYDGNWRFSHKELRSATLAATPEDAQPDLHRQIAEAIEAVYPDQPQQAGVLVQHWHDAGNEHKERLYAQQAGEYSLRINNFVEAITYFERALELLPKTVPAQSVSSQRADLLIKLGEALQHTGDYNKSLAALQEGLDLCRKVNEPGNSGRALNLIGDVEWRRGDYAQAAQACNEALQVCREIDDQRGIARALNRLGMLNQERGDYSSAKQHFRDSLNVARALDDQQSVANAINNLGLWAFMQGNYGEAAQFFEETLAIARANGERRKMAAALLNLGGAAGAQSNFDAAYRYFEETLGICRAIGERRGVALALNNLGVLSYDRKEFDAAASYLEESLQISRSIGNRTGEAEALKQLGRVAHAQNEDARAEDFYEQALQTASDIKHVPLMLDVVTHIAILTPRQMHALRWLGLVLAHPAVTEGIREEINPVVEQAKKDLSPEDVETYLEEGKSLELAEVVAEILDA